MRRITKVLLLATNFHQAIDEFENLGQNHPSYSRSAFRNEHYEDVFMNLIVSQKGLCAYTEELITIRFEEITANWTDGKYHGDLRRKNFDSTIDHYDSSLKPDKGWLYGNLFAVLTAVNTSKLRKIAIGDLKPDSPDYDPFKYLAYNFSTHRFIPNPTLIKQSPELFIPIKDSIEALSLNMQTIIDRRLEMLEEYKFDIKNGDTFINIQETKLKRFFTAFEMSRAYLEAN